MTATMSEKRCGDCYERRICTRPPRAKQITYTFRNIGECKECKQGTILLVTRVAFVSMIAFMVRIEYRVP